MYLPVLVISYFLTCFVSNFIGPFCLSCWPATCGVLALMGQEQDVVDCWSDCFNSEKLCLVYWSLFSSAALDFSDKGKYLALAERRDCKDYVSIFSCESWSLVRVCTKSLRSCLLLSPSPLALLLYVCMFCVHHSMVHCISPTFCNKILS